MTEPDFDGDLQVLRSTARLPLTPEQQAWDAKWQPLYDRRITAGDTPNAAIRRADRLMDQHNHGLRPQPEENQT